jgi:hypothetical protein
MNSLKINPRIAAMASVDRFLLSQLACLQERWRAWLWAKSSPHGTDASYRACGKPTHPLSSSPGTQEGYDVVEAANSYEGLQAADMALLEGVTLDIRYCIVW